MAVCGPAGATGNSEFLWPRLGQKTNTKIVQNRVLNASSIAYQKGKISKFYPFPFHRPLAQGATGKCEFLWPRLGQKTHTKIVQNRVLYSASIAYKKGKISQNSVVSFCRATGKFEFLWPRLGQKTNTKIDQNRVLHSASIAYKKGKISQNNVVSFGRATLFSPEIHFFSPETLGTLFFARNALLFARNSEPRGEECEKGGGLGHVLGMAWCIIGGNGRSAGGRGRGCPKYIFRPKCISFRPK